MSVRSVNILVRDCHRRSLLQFRDAATSAFPLTWGLWGGGIAATDDSPAHCAARELAEELAINAKPDDFTLVGARHSTHG